MFILVIYILISYNLYKNERGKGLMFLVLKIFTILVLRVERIFIVVLSI